MKSVKSILLLLASIFAVSLTSTSHALQDGVLAKPTISRQDSAPSTDVKPEGVRLPLKYKCLDEDVLKEAAFTPLTSGRMLIGVCDRVSMLDPHGKVMWQYTVPQMLFDYAYIESSGLIYGTAGDNTMFILDAASGKELVLNSRNGSAGYGEVKAYGKDQCLIIDSNAGYRDRLNDPSIKDRVTAWRGTQILWSTDFPPDASLVVNGDKILAVSKTKTSLFIKEIAIPKSDGK